MFVGKSLQLGRVSGIAIGLDYSWFIIFGLFVFLLGSAYLPTTARGMAPGWYWAAAVLTALLFFSSVLVHELSHAVVARRRGIPINRIILFIFGGVAQMEDEPQTPGDELQMALAGPAASVAIAGLFFGLAWLADFWQSRLMLQAFLYLTFINVVLAVFNLLPGFPLDGGRVFRAILWHITGNLRKATRIAAIVGQGMGGIFILIGLSSLIVPEVRAYTSVWLALIGWFLVSAARTSYGQVVARETLASVPLWQMMNTRIEAVPAEWTVDQLVRDYFLHQTATAVPVTDGEELIGMATLAGVQTIPQATWSQTPVRLITQPMEDGHVLPPDEDAWAAVNRMARGNWEQVFIGRAGHVEGVVTRGTIARWLQTHGNLAPGTA
jgi:Zn-dependent protease